MVKLRKLEDRKFLSPEKKQRIISDRKMKLKELTDSCNLNEYMGELLLNEIKLTSDSCNQQLRERVCILGL